MDANLIVMNDVKNCDTIVIKNAFRIVDFPFNNFAPKCNGSAVNITIIITNKIISSAIINNCSIAINKK